jgi:hypothetical protein
MTNLTTLFGGAAIFTTIGLVWDKIRFFMSRLSSLFLVTIRINNNIPKAMEVYLVKNFKKSPFQPLAFSSFRDYIKSIKKRHVIGYEEVNFKDKAIFWKGWKPLIISIQNDSDGKGSRPTQVGSYDGQASITFIRGTFNADKLIIDALELFNERNIKNDKISRFTVYRHFGSSGKNNEEQNIRGKAEVTDSSGCSDIFLGDKRILKYKIDDIGEDQDDKRSLNVLAFPKEIDALVDEIERWKNSEKWYRKRSIPWKRGWLLWGIPGTGKTSLAKAIGQYLDLPIHVFDLSGMSNYEFYREWSGMLSSTPCIALVEDIDSVFVGRENVRNKNNNMDLLTFDCFLNCIDGVQNTDGLFLIITTNRVEMLDEALGKPRTDKDPNGTNISTRPGRIDRAFELKKLDKDCRIKIAKRILSDCCQYIDSIVEKGDGDTGAQFQERCTQIALKDFWENNKDVENFYDNEKLVQKDHMYKKRLEDEANMILKRKEEERLIKERKHK